MRSFGKYLPEEQLGAGGMAEVWRASVLGPQGFRKVIALKRILPARLEDPLVVQLFIDEARNAATLQHPNIVQIHDFGRIDGEYFIAMELVDGVDLSKIFRALRTAGQDFPLQHATYVCGELLKALHHAHGRNPPLVHRDVTPSNILVSYEGHVKLSDFGIARPAAEVTEYTTTLAGKVRYMSPEQLQRLRPDQRSDLYSVGIILYETLTGQRFPESNEIPSAIDVRRDVPPELDSIAGKLLVRDRDQRYQSAADVLRDLRALPCYQPSDLDLGSWLQIVVPKSSSEQVGDKSTSILSSPAGRPRAIEAPTLGTTTMAASQSFSVSEIERNPPQKWRRPGLVLAMAGLAAAMGATAVKLWDRSLAGPGNHATESSAVSPIPVAPTSPVVKIEISTDPPDAALIVDGRPTLERTLEFLPRTNHVLLAHKPGFVEQSMELTAETNRKISLVLTPEPKEPQSLAGRVRRTRKRSSTRPAASATPSPKPKPETRIPVERLWRDERSTRTGE